MAKIVIFDVDETIGMLNKDPVDGLRNIAIYGRYFVVRPYIEEYIKMNINEGNLVGIWSAGGKQYVDSIMKNFDINFEFVWGNDKCVNYQIKDLRKVLEEYPEYEEVDIIFFDDNEKHIKFNEKFGFGCIHVPRFELDKNDKYFMTNEK